jgi:hypothetical protein
VELEEEAEAPTGESAHDSRSNCVLNSTKGKSGQCANDRGADSCKDIGVRRDFQFLSHVVSFPMLLKLRALSFCAFDHFWCRPRHFNAATVTGSLRLSTIHSLVAEQISKFRN